MAKRICSVPFSAVCLFFFVRGVGGTRKHANNKFVFIVHCFIVIMERHLRCTCDSIYKLPLLY